MQTFLPFPSFVKSADCLDRARLGKQRVEAKQILTTLTGESFGWRNHPAVRMWRGFPRLLALYGWIMCAEWRKRGYEDNLQSVFRNALDSLPDECEVPSWLAFHEFHASHRSQLFYKDPDHYGAIFGWQPKRAYWWPR